MTSCNISCLLLLKMFITLLPVFEATQIQVLPEVTGYVGHAVTLPCQFIRTHQEVKVTLVEWRLKQQEEEDSTSIVFFLSEEKVFVSDTFLKDRVNISEQSLIIKDVQMRDAGLYTCIISTFPYGSLEGTTRLVVQEPTLKVRGQMLLIKLIAFGVFVLIIVTMATTTYCTIIKIRSVAGL
ncbi:nectin-2-like [Cheilinus undulatus]|uniref:nectin-2-like n=1 Tax=Cheilinus undulatus TaxID=241271 RepID=UPI001BD695C3|nr:nectin-2-like [Cheilinus undulatus]